MRYRKGEVLFYHFDDPKNPIKKWDDFLTDNKRYTIDDREYEVIIMQGCPLDFMIRHSPTYALLKDRVLEKLKPFLSQKIRGDRQSL